MMNKNKQTKLEAKGWKIGSATDFLNLSSQEIALIEMKLSLSRSLKERRTKQRLSQEGLAKLIKSSQSRVAKMEAGDSSVSIDLLIKSLLALGASQNDVAKSIALKN